MKIEIYRRGQGWLPASEDAESVRNRMSQGEIAWVKVLRVRDPVSHRRYWGLMSLCADNCERIELPGGGVMTVHSKDDVHTAIKICTGHCDTVFDANGHPAFVIPRHTNYESMTADEWNHWWPHVIQAVQEHVLPGVSIPEIENELLKCMGLAA